MLCERCHEREAKVHVRVVIGAEMTKHDFCEACAVHPEGGNISTAVLQGWKSYDSQHPASSHEDK
jgi:protein-arginine kinase activator protein McsA